MSTPDSFPAAPFERPAPSSPLPPAAAPGAHAFATRVVRAPRTTVLARPTFAEPEHLPVEWRGEGSDGERLAEFAGRLCYMSQRNPAGRTTRDYLENIKRQGHGSVLEHAVYSVLVEGVSRSLTHELVRHRAGFGYCLAGDTLIHSEHRDHGRRNSTKKWPIRALFEMTKTPHGRSQLKLLRLRCLDETTGTFVTGRVLSVVASGVKPVFRVELEDGKTITCTKEHRFLTRSGWRPLQEIVGGLGISAGELAVAGGLAAEIMVNGTLAYRDREWLRRQYHERNLDQESIAQLAGGKRREQNPRWKGGITPRRIALRELLEPPRGSEPVLTSRARRIVRVTYAGEQETFDIEMEGPHCNFVANGIITHNSQLSQRYVNESDAAFVVPPAILDDDALEEAWSQQMQSALRSYEQLVESLMERYGWVSDKVHRRKMAREAARGVLPNSTETKIVVTGNARAWRTMLELRAGEGAELEIRRLAVALLRLLAEEAPAFFDDFEIYQAADRREAARVTYSKV